MGDNPSLHALLLLSDSALPLGSFAFSSGLESYLAHRKLKPSQTPSSSPSTSKKAPLQDFETFLSTSLQNLSSTALPYVLTAYSEPARLRALDNDVDASTACGVARRASVSQGRAFLALWERVFRGTVVVDDEMDDGMGGRGMEGDEMEDGMKDEMKDEMKEVLERIEEFVTLCKSRGKGNSSSSTNHHSENVLLTTISSEEHQHQEQICNAHFAPLFGIICRALGLTKAETSYLFLLNHAKALLSAAVRASVMGPYQSQALLAGVGLRKRILSCVDRERDTEVEDAGLTVPPMDLWMGRHELLYSRIFNS